MLQLLLFGGVVVQAEAVDIRRHPDIRSELLVAFLGILFETGDGSGQVWVAEQPDYHELWPEERQVAGKLQRQRLGDREPFSIYELIFIHVQAGGVLDKVEVELSVVNGV